LPLQEIIFGVLLVLVLLGMGAYYGYRQVQSLRTLGPDSDMPVADRSHFRRQALRRLVCSVLMFVFAGFLVGWFFLSRELAAVPPPDPDRPTEHPLVRTITFYWIAALFVLFGLLALAVFDLIATARHGFRSSRLLENERRAELEAEVARIRRERAERN